MDAGQPGAEPTNWGSFFSGPGLGARRGDRRVLPAPVLPQAARPQLGEPGGAGGGLRDDALVAGPRRRRLPHGRHQLHLQGPGAPDVPDGAVPAAPYGDGSAALHLRPAHPRVPRRDAPRGVRRTRRRPAHGRRDARRRPSSEAVLFTDPARARGRHGVPVRARRRLDQGATASGTSAPFRPARPQGDVRPLAGGAGRGRLEQPVLEQPRPAADRVPLRRRRRVPGAVRHDARARCCTCTAARRTSTRARSSA